jgi:hypothetical protein
VGAAAASREADRAADQPDAENRNLPIGYVLRPLKRG